MIPEVTCAQCRESLIWYAAGQLAAAERDLIERHLATCTDCRAELRQWRKAASSLTRDDDLPPDRDADATWNHLLAQLPPSPQANGKTPVRGSITMSFDSDDNNMLQTVTSVKTKGSPPKFRRAFLAPVAAILLVVLSVVVFGTVRLHYGGHPAPIATPTPQATALPAVDPNHPSVVALKPQNLNLPVPVSFSIDIIAISMLTANDGWAAVQIGPLVDNSGPNNGASSIRPYFVHFHNGVWTLAPDTFPVGYTVESMVMTSPDEGWAIGYTYTSQQGQTGSQLVWHFTGGHWRLTTIPVLPKDNSIGFAGYDAIHAPTPDFVYIEANRNDSGNEQVLLTYHAGTWSLISTPLSGYTFRVSMVSPDEGWAEEDTGGTADFLHYQHGNWNDVTQVFGQAAGISMLSAQEGWAMTEKGFYHFTGKTWQLATFPDPQHLRGGVLQATAPGELWLAGGNSVLSNLTEFVNHGQTQVLPFPQPYDYVGQITTDSDGGVWALAHLYARAPNRAPDAILYDLHGVWTIYGLAQVS